ncbi:MAG: tRNA (adenosine(37)-N6)-threonylcarbamoyltransferase complex transferase subunit TsaD [Pseudomonadota bacterium]
MKYVVIIKYILGIETSCDDTSIGYISFDQSVVKHYTYNQLVHVEFKGVVPALAAREHLSNIQSVMHRVLEDITLKDIVAVAVTVGPGLIASLMIGVNYGKMLAHVLGVDFIPIHHLEGHMFSAYMRAPVVHYPYLSLLVSGGHTQYILANKFMDYEIIGRSIDDALGECFDKVGVMLGLEYPAGAKIEQLAKLGRSDKYDLPLPLINKKDSCDMSFSGLKTAVMRLVNSVSVDAFDGIDDKSASSVGVSSDALSASLLNKNISSTSSSSILNDQIKYDIAASFQNCICKVLLEKTNIALSLVKERGIDLQNFIVVGGVSANQDISIVLSKLVRSKGVTYTSPDLLYCMDNGSMIARAGLEYYNNSILLSQNNAIARWRIDHLK